MSDKTTTRGDAGSTTSQATSETTGETTTVKRRPWQRRSTTDDAGGRSVEVAKVRKAVGQVLWLVCAVFALILALAVLLIAVEANARNELVRWIIARADNVDLGFFDLSNPIKDFDSDKGEVEDVKTALFNYGIAAIVWLGIGKLLERIVRP